jgi:hypothetical protein
MDQFRPSPWIKILDRRDNATAATPASLPKLSSHFNPRLRARFGSRPQAPFRLRAT